MVAPPTAVAVSTNLTLKDWIVPVVSSVVVQSEIGGVVVIDIGAVEVPVFRIPWEPVKK